MLCLTMSMSFVACEYLPGGEQTEEESDGSGSGNGNKPNDSDDGKGSNDGNSSDNPDNGGDSGNPNDPNSPDDGDGGENGDNPDDGEGGNDGGDSSGSTSGGESSLTPGEHKRRLEDIALEFVNSFNLSDVEEISETLWNLSEYLEDDDFPEYYSDMMQSIARGVKTMSIADFKQFTTRASEDFVIDINDPDTNPYAGHSYTYNNYKWVEGTADNKSIKFIWDHSEALLTWDDTKKFEYEYDDDDDINYVVYVPKNITFTLKIDGDQHLNITINTNITDIRTLAPSVEVKINGGYVVKFSSNANNKGLEVASSIQKNGKTLTTATSVVAINDATDIDSWFKEFYCEECYENHWTLSPDYGIYNVKTGKGQIDILDLSIVFEGDLNGMYATIEDYEDEYDWYDSSYNYIPSKYKQYCEAVCKLINDNIKIILVYNDTNEHVADIVMQTAVEEDYYYGNDYYMEPILLFPDESKYAFEEFFTERAFGDLLDRIEEIINQLEDNDLI